ncbi:hypothetical protein CRBSH125_02280 [Afipia carboxidovorans]|nr:hypothetical protein CRBSH125_02280 [Afipia carboxidovorans]
MEEAGWRGRKAGDDGFGHFGWFNRSRKGWLGDGFRALGRAFIILPAGCLIVLAKMLVWLTKPRRAPGAMQRVSGALQNRDRSGDCAWDGPGSAERRCTPHRVRGMCLSPSLRAFTLVFDELCGERERPLGAVARIWHIRRNVKGRK